LFILWFWKEEDMITKSDSNAAIITRLHNVRKHPNADRLQLATALGTQVIVGLDAKEDDLVIYFDSNLRLSHDYIHHNNLYSNKELNANPEIKGYFGKNGRVRAQKFRGELSNGYVAELYTIDFVGIHPILKDGDEFTHINGVEICSKYIVPAHVAIQRAKEAKRKSVLFHRHWDTKQLMRELDSIPENVQCWIEEKIHGTSGRTAHLLCKTFRPWWKFWKPKEEWKVISGTRRMDNVEGHLPYERNVIERMVAPRLHKGEEIYYEIYGYDTKGQFIQTGYPYNCRPGEFKVMLYRVTITTPDGYCIDLDRETVYKRAIELGLEKPFGIDIGLWERNNTDLVDSIVDYAQGKSYIDAGTLLEGIVVWFEDENGNWTCLKHKSEEFLLDQDKQMEKEVGDIEDSI
jgi:hypothetical protein